MKLSEAIRAGAKIRPQKHGDFYGTQERPVCTNGILGLVVIERSSSCALGAAFEAVGCGYKTKILTADEPGTMRVGKYRAGESVQVMQQPNEWNGALLFDTECPQCGKADTANRIIPHLNDDHRWTREEIALWVERIERQVEWLNGAQEVAREFVGDEIEIQAAEFGL